MTFVPARTLEDVLKVALPRRRPMRARRSPDPVPSVVLLHLRPRLRPRLPPDRDHQRCSAPRGPTCGIVVRTSAPRWLFERTVRVPFTLIAGAVRHRRRPDRQPAARRSGDDRRGRGVSTRTLRDRAAARGGPAREHDARFVIADAPPLACAAAARPAFRRSCVELHLGLDLRGVSGDELLEAPDLIPAIRDAYRGRTRPGGCRCTAGSRTFRPIVDVPFVARHARHYRGEVRDAARTACRTRRLALSSFGGYGVQRFRSEPTRLLSSYGVVRHRSVSRDGNSPPPRRRLRPRGSGSTARASATRTSSPPWTSSSPSRATGSSRSASRTTPRCSTRRAANSVNTTSWSRRCRGSCAASTSIWTRCSAAAGETRSIASWQRPIHRAARDQRRRGHRVDDRRKSVDSCLLPPWCVYCQLRHPPQVLLSGQLSEPDVAGLARRKSEVHRRLARPADRS